MSEMKTIPHLKAWREERKLTQLHLAIKAGVGQMTIIRIEQGAQAKEQTIQRLAHALEVSTQDLINGHETQS